MCTYHRRLFVHIVPGCPCLISHGRMAMPEVHFHCLQFYSIFVHCVISCEVYNTTWGTQLVIGSLMMMHNLLFTLLCHFGRGFGAVEGLRGLQETLLSTTLLFIEIRSILNRDCSCL